jgi:hypothetical protein
LTWSANRNFVETLDSRAATPGESHPERALDALEDSWSGSRHCRWLATNGGAMSSRTTSWATWCTPIAGGWSCRRRAAPPATTTATEADRSAQSGVPATIGTWRGDAIAAQCFTRRSPDRTAESATAAQCQCTRSGTVVVGSEHPGDDRAKRQPVEDHRFASVDVWRGGDRYRRRLAGLVCEMSCLLTMHATLRPLGRTRRVHIEDYEAFERRNWAAPFNAQQRHWHTGNLAHREFDAS